MSARSSIQTLVGLHVTDPDSYLRYRETVAPLLEAHGATLEEDHRVSAMDGAIVAHPVNRLLILSFPDAHARKAFFESESVRRMQRQFFDPSVERMTTVTRYEVFEN